MSCQEWDLTQYRSSPFFLQKRGGDVLTCVHQRIWIPAACLKMTARLQRVLRVAGRGWADFSFCGRGFFSKASSPPPIAPKNDHCSSDSWSFYLIWTQQDLKKLTNKKKHQNSITSQHTIFVSLCQRVHCTGHLAFFLPKHQGWHEAQSQRETLWEGKRFWGNGKYTNQRSIPSIPICSFMIDIFPHIYSWINWTYLL